MSITEIVEQSCKQSTLAAALAYVAIWETERVVKQARQNPTWDTCFEYIFNCVIDQWNKTHT